MQLTQLRYFQCLAHFENYHTAAEKLYISQPSLNNAIHKLEEELNIPLFVKTGRNITLTEEGKEFLKYVDVALAQLDQGIQELQAKQNRTEQILVGSIMPAYSTFLSPLLSSFQDTCGCKVVYHTYIYPSEVLLEKLLLNEFDLIFCTKMQDVRNVTFEPIYDMPYMVAVSCDDPLAQKTYVIPEDLNHRKLLFSTPGAYANIVNEILESFGVKTDICGYANEEIALLDMVANGQGIFITTDYPQLHDQRTRLIPLKQDKYKRTFYVAYRNDLPVRPVISDLLQHAKKIHV